MSHAAYEIFSIIPDFSQEPEMGMGEQGRVDTLIGMTPGKSTWVGTGALAFRFLYRTQNPEESSIFREAMERIKGRWAPFYLPSWGQDFTLEAPATAGDTTITLSNEGFSALTEQRPDTEKRVIFALTTGGDLYTWNVRSATEDGDGNEVVGLDTPIVDDLDPETTMMGYCYLVRLADDAQDWRYDAPGQGSVELRFVTRRITRKVETEELVDGEQIGELYALEGAAATDEDPELEYLLAPESIGPRSYGSPQGINYHTEWRATFSNSTTVELLQIDSKEVTESELYDSRVQSDHLAFAFDSASRELLAWNHTTPGEIRMRWYAGGEIEELNFQGISPLAFNTWSIDGTVTLGEAETAIFYLKKGYSAIFVRLEREGYSIERQWGRCTAAPLYLNRISAPDAEILIAAMDVGHRRLILKSAQYEPAIFEVFTPPISLVEGEYEFISKLVKVGPESISSPIALPVGFYENSQKKVETLPEIMRVSILSPLGEYSSPLVKTEVSQEALSSPLSLTEIKYELTTISTESTEEAFAANLKLVEGTYDQA